MYAADVMHVSTQNISRIRLTLYSIITPLDAFEISCI